MILELPVVYSKGNEYEHEVKKTTIVINDFAIITINQALKEDQSTLQIDQEGFLIDLEYETLRILLQEQLRVIETPLATKEINSKNSGLESFTLTLNGYWDGDTENK